MKITVNSLNQHLGDVCLGSLFPGYVICFGLSPLPVTVANEGL